MKIIDNMPIVVIVAALFFNIAIGISNSVDFSMLMIRCIIVTIVFGIFSYMLAKTLRSAVEYSRLSKLAHKKDAEAKDSSFDIKVPPLDDEELLRINNESDDDFVELNPVRMNGYKNNEQE